VLKASTLLNDACVALCEGQHLDLSFESRDAVSMAEYQAMIVGKTASLLGASAAIGALAGGAPDDAVNAFTRCGLLLGLAFQVQDDVLGTWGDTALTGKPAGDDIRSRKKSFPVVYAMEHLEGARGERLRAIYASREPMTEDEFEDVLAALDDAGAHDAARTAAQAHASEALTALASLDLAAGPRSEIAALAEFFVQRSA
jgi:geranylgeranyl diphosphate synthase type I